MLKFFETPIRTVQETFGRHAACYPEKTALICGEDRLTWRELNDRMNRVGNSLQRIGISKGEKACVLMPTMTETTEVMFGIVKAGAAMVPLSGLVQSETLALMINDSDAKAIFVGPGLESLVAPIRDTLVNIPPENFISVGFEKEGWVPYQEFLADASAEEPDIKYDFEDLWSILYTSGTTGVPKGVMHTQYGRLMYTMTLIIGYRVTDLSKVLVSTPLYTSGTMMLYISTLFCGGTVVLMPQFEPGEWLRIAEKEKPTHTFLVPTQYYMILAHPDLETRDVAHFEMMTSTGSPLMPDAKKKIIQRFGKVFWELYGLTEGVATTLDAEDVLRKAASVGKPASTTVFHIIDDEGNILPPGEIGEIVGYGPALLKGYYKKPEATSESIWIDAVGRHFLRTGDMGKMDEEGFLYVLDRKKDMIISGGANIYAADIEKVINQHPQVEDSAVIAVPHPKWGERPRALVIRKEGASITEDELMQWINERVAKYQRVDKVEFRTEFPRNALMKILKRQLRDPYWAEVGLSKIS